MATFGQEGKKVKRKQREDDPSWTLCLRLGIHSNYRALLMSCQQMQCLESGQGSSQVQENLGEVGSAPSFASELCMIPENPRSRSQQHLYPNPKFLRSSSLSRAPEEAPSKSFRSVPHPPAFPLQICSPQLLQEAQLAQLRRKHGQSILGTSLGALTLYKC